MIKGSTPAAAGPVRRSRPVGGLPTTVLSGLAAVAALSLAGCGSHTTAASPASGTTSSAATSASASMGSTGATATAAPGQPLTVNVTDSLRFQPDHISLAKGPITIKLVNAGNYPHNFTIPSLHVMSKDVTGTPGQQSTTLSFTISKPGTYNFLCTYHNTAGMVGVLTVTG